MFDKPLRLVFIAESTIFFFFSISNIIVLIWREDEGNLWKRLYVAF